LAENNRLNQLEGVAEKFGTLMSAARGEVEMTVVSAAPLDAKVLRQLESSVSKSSYVGQGKKLKVVSKVNPDIRGGLIVEIGDRFVPAGLRVDRVLDFGEAGGEPVPHQRAVPGVGRRCVQVSSSLLRRC